MERFADAHLLSVDFIEWQSRCIEIIVEMQKGVIASYKKSRWKVNGTTFKNMHKEGLSPKVAANLWGLAHQK